MAGVDIRAVQELAGQKKTEKMLYVHLAPEQEERAIGLENGVPATIPSVFAMLSQPFVRL